MWYLQPILDSYLLVVILAMALVVLLGFAPSFGHLTRRQRGVLVALRGLVIVLVTLAMLRPTYVGTQSRPQSSTLIVLLDRSRSMGIGDTAQGKTRWQLQREALRDAAPLLNQLREEMEVLVYAFDSAAHPVALEGDGLRLDPRPTGDESDIGTSLDDVLRSATGKRLAGVVLLSDGAQRALAPRVDIQQPARELARLGYPLYTIPLGLSRDQAQARDVAVDNLPDQYSVFVKNELEVHALLRSQGYANREVPVQLVVEFPGGNREILGPVPLRPTADGQQLDIEFVYTPEKPGQYKLTVEAAAQPGELVTSNNALSAFLTVQEGGLRVLYLFGSVLGGQRIECQSISSSPDIQLDYRWVDARQRSQWPIRLDASVFQNTYDVFLLGDLDSDALGQAQCQALAEAVRAGKGLMMLGGYHSFGPGGYRDTALADVLPVVIGRHERQSFDEPRRTDVHLNGPLTVLPTRPHFITRLRPGQQNETAWKQLPPILGANKFSQLKESNTQVLAQTTSGDPILVAGPYGAGRVLALAVDSTSPWYRYGFHAEHERFWRQAILWLARKEDALGDGVWAKLDQRRFYRGDRIAFTAGASGADGQPLDDVVLEAKVVGPDQTEAPARLSPAGQQWAGTLEPIAAPGDYQLQVVGRRDGQEVGSAQQSFVVLDRDLELSEPAANPQQLEQLALLTKEVGGKSLAPEQLPGLLKQIRQRPPKMEIEVQSEWQLADTELDAWLFFLCVVGLLSGEWYLRKKWRLV